MNYIIKNMALALQRYSVRDALMEVSARRWDEPSASCGFLYHLGRGDAQKDRNHGTVG